MVLGNRLASDALLDRSLPCENVTTRSQYLSHGVALEPRRNFHERRLPQFLGKAHEESLAYLGMRHLAATEDDRRFHLVAVEQKTLRVSSLELKVMFVDLRTEFDLFDVYVLLTFSGLRLPLGLLVEVLTRVHDATNRRIGVRRDLDEIESLLLGYGQRLGRRHDAELRTVFVYHPHLTRADALVDA
jgi:hypothetical protein